MTTHVPPRCANTSIAAKGNGEVVLLNCGNYPSYSSLLNQTWSWGGSDWTNKSTSTTALIDPNGPLPGRINCSMDYDGTNIMLFGGQGDSSTTGGFADTWTFNGTSWSKKSPATSPTMRWSAETGYISGVGVILFGGQNSLFNLNETWKWDGTTWLQIATTTQPAAKVGHVMASDQTTIVLFGGEMINQQSNHTWKYTNSGGWSQITAITPPSVRSHMCMCYDSVNSIFVMYGGKNSAGYLNETYTFSLSTSTWTKQSPAVSPPGLIGAQMEFDKQSNTTILFGGISATTNYPSLDTWQFNGSSLNWTKL